jgi:hypothetical protein
MNRVFRQLDAHCVVLPNQSRVGGAVHPSTTHRHKTLLTDTTGTSRQRSHGSSNHTLLLKFKSSQLAGNLNPSPLTVAESHARCFRTCLSNRAAAVSLSRITAAVHTRRRPQPFLCPIPVALGQQSALPWPFHPDQVRAWPLRIILPVCNLRQCPQARRTQDGS